MGYKMNFKKKIVVLIVLAFLGMVLVYNSPEENNKYEADLHGTIKAGRLFSWLLFIGSKNSLFRQFDFTEYARSKLKKADIQEVVGIDILDKYEDSGGKYEDELQSILFAESKDIELVALEKRQNMYAMTFKFDNQLIGCPNIPGKGGMVYSAVFRYYEPHDGIL